jgi:Flp pilus assembly protein TadG
MPKRISFKNQQGQSMTEFALVLPILALLLFGVIQFGIVFNHYLTLTDAVRAGARKAAVGRHLPDPPGSAKAAVRAAATDLNQADLNVTVTVTPGWAAGAEATVSADYPYSIKLLGVPIKTGRMHSTTKERVE